jgi:hypothetical protein
MMAARFSRSVGHVAFDAERVLDDLGGAVAVVAVDRLLKQIGQGGNWNQYRTASFDKDHGGNVGCPRQIITKN